MRISLLITATCLLIAGAGVIAEHRPQAMILSPGTPQEAMRVADITDGTGGIRTWTRMMELGGLENFGKSPQTLFVPSDAAFKSLPKDELRELLAPGNSDARRALS